jgi:hypothetical protein
MRREPLILRKDKLEKEPGSPLSLGRKIGTILWILAY